MVLNIESLSLADVLSLSFSILEFVISLLGFTGGVNMAMFFIVVGIGFNGGQPSDKAQQVYRTYTIKRV